MQEPAQAVLYLASLPHERLAVIEEQPQVAGGLVLHGDRQVRVGERRARDRERVDCIGLPESASVLPCPCHQLRRDADDPLTTREQEALKSPADAAHVLECPDALGVDRLRPGQQLGVARRPRGSGELVDELTAAGPDGDVGVRLLVRVNSDNQLHHLERASPAPKAGRPVQPRPSCSS